MFSLTAWQTWIAHGAVGSATTAALAYGFDIDPYLAATYPVFFYTVRELDQILKHVIRDRPINVLDTIMDVVSPTISSFLTAWLIGG